MSKGLPPTLLHALRKVLMECPEMSSHRNLYTVMETESLKPLQKKLREADSIETRVNYVISDLWPRSVKGQNAMLSLLNELQHRQEGTDLAERLLTLYNQLAWYLSLSGQENRIPESKDGASPQYSMLSIKEVELQLQCAKSVALVRNAPNRGTAWLIGPGIAVSCQHVFRGASFDDTLLVFDFLDVGRGIGYKVKDTLFSAEKDDFVILRLIDREDYPLSYLSYLRIEMDPQLVPHGQLPIIQHPLGGPQQRAIGTFHGIADEEQGTILYDTPTEPGTSGSPVLNRINWRVVAVHRGRRGNLGMGLSIKKLMSVVQRDSPSLYDEIVQVQRR